MSAPFNRDLLSWYQHNKADLPWRRDREPYRVWLAEIMLQQTQVETVIPYFERFVAAFPTIEALADAPLDAVLKLWEGLGYYSRARNLHRAASIVVESPGGRLPADVADLMRLPGIGRYTAGAISSIAFGHPAPVLDGNVMRLFARLLDLPDEISERATQERLWRQAEAWLPANQAGDYNQALMELGQRICRPKQPLCGSCPIQSHCAAHATGTVDQRPIKKKRPPIPHFDVAAGLIRDGAGKLLIARRPLEGLLGGLWEFPGGKQEPGETLPACLARELREELAIEVEVGALFAVVEHAFTHFKITLHAFDCRYICAIPPHTEPQCLGAMDWAWIDEAELARYSFGKADRQVIAALSERRKMLL